jgi:hypothetical protein
MVASWTVAVNMLYMLVYKLPDHREKFDAIFRTWSVGMDDKKV